MQSLSIPVSKSFSLPAYFWPCEPNTKQGAILLLHGFTQHGANYARVAEWFVARGYDFMVYDHRDHGHSSARNQVCTLDSVVDDACIVIDFCYEKNNGDKVLLMGSSMGGAISLLATQFDEQSIQDKLLGLVLWAPQVVATKKRRFTFQLLELARHLIPNAKLPLSGFMISNLPRQCDDKAFTDKLAKDKLMLRNPNVSLVHRVLAMGDRAAQVEFQKPFSLLLLFGGKDSLIFQDDIDTFVSHVEQTKADIQYKFYPNNRHMLWADNNRENLYQDTFDWMRNLTR